MTYSSEFDNAAWVKTDATIAANTIIAPDGTLTADKLTETTANAGHRIYEGVTATAVAHTFSFYAKAGGRNFVYAGFTPGSATYAYFDLANGTVGSVDVAYTSASISAVGNGWYRCSVTRTATAATWYAEVGSASANGTFSYTGDGYSGAFIWGAQLEALAFSTSYIPTVASQVTRAADSASMTGTNFSSWYNQGEGSVYSEFSYMGNNIVSYVVEFLESTNSNNRWYIEGNGGLNRAQFVMRPLNSVQAGLADSGVNNPPNTMTKVAGAYKVNDFEFSQNGRNPLIDTSGYVTNNLDQLLIGGRLLVFLNGSIKKISYYPIALTSTQIQALTS